MNESDYERMAERRRARQKKRRHQVLMMKGIILAVLVVVLVIASSAAWHFLSPSGDAKKNPKANNLTASSDTKNTENTSAGETESETSSETETEGTSDPIAEARLLAAGYDYDGAIDLLKSVDSYESKTEIMAAIQEFETTKASCVAVDVTTVPHIFYHSLINDTTRAFDVSVLGQSQVDGMNAWMTTVEEFDKITQTMYDNGYVFVRLRDLVTETTDENGNVTFAPNQNLMLPPDKKAVVLSVDDLSYYHSYQKAGYPDKLILDENGDVKCHYVTADGTEEVGDFDVVPRLNTFLKEHPDGAYKGARGLIALTGYNGVFGYRTDSDYETKEHLQEDQAKWLEEHPDFNRQTEIQEATVIANALKEEGWEFASHTWGHLSVTDKTVDELKNGLPMFKTSSALWTLSSLPTETTSVTGMTTVTATKSTSISRVPAIISSAMWMPLSPTGYRSAITTSARAVSIWMAISSTNPALVRPRSSTTCSRLPKSSISVVLPR